MKKLLALLLVLCSVSLCGCIYLPEISTSISVSNGNPSSIESIESNTESTSGAVDESCIEIIAEYTFSEVSVITYHIVIVKNICDRAISIDTDTLAYNEYDELISVGTGYMSILEPGNISCYIEEFRTGEKIAKYETTRTVSASLYAYGTSDISYSLTKTSNGEIVQITNNGDAAIKFARGHILYFLDGNIVGYDRHYFMDSDAEIKPGKTISGQYIMRHEYDSVEFYLN